MSGLRRSASNLAAPNAAARLRCLTIKTAIAIACICAPLAASAQCTVTSTPILFGTYDPFAAAANHGTGTITVACEAPTPYQIAIGTGVAGSFDRRLLSITGALAYSLYSDAGRSSVWGDGSGATSRVSGSGLGAIHDIYGAIPARQNVRAGSYVDSLVVTIEF
ncbi:hypothetical protein BH09PSE5_BH09PSE5_00130 [soil metagenome]